MSSALVHFTDKLAFSSKERDTGKPFMVNLGFTITYNEIEYNAPDEG